MYDVRSGACRTWYVIEKLENSSGSTRPTLEGITDAARRLVALLLLLLLVEAVVVLCLAARLHVGHRTAGGASRTSVFMPKLPNFFATCMWVYMRLDGSKRSECLPVAISQISRLWTLRVRAMDPGRDLNMHPGFRRVPRPPGCREHEKRLAGGRAKNANVPKKFILYWYQLRV